MGHGRHARPTQVAKPAAPRDAIAQALAGAVDGSVAEIAYVPTDDVRRALAETLPSLPAEMGGTSPGPLARDVRWATLSVAIAPAPTARLTIRCVDAPAAAAAAKFIRDVVTAAAPLTAAAAKAGPHELRTVAADLAAVLAALAPAANGDLVTIDVRPAQADVLLRALVPAVVNAREQARTAASLSTARQIVLACAQDAETHQGAWPPDLASLVKANLLTDAVLTNPRTAKPNGYVYLRPANPV